MTKRIKPAPALTLDSLDAVDGALYEVAQFRARIKAIYHQLARIHAESDYEVAQFRARIKAAAEERINAVRRAAAETAAPQLARIQELERAILTFAETHRNTVFTKGRKSVELQFGSLGYRKSTKISVKKSTLDKLKELGFEDGIRRTEAVNKEAMQEWPDDRLALVDARRQAADTFWYEVKELEILEHAASGVADGMRQGE